jgi:malate dehydrogenase (oxaloacetate-decarboxylating)
MSHVEETPQSAESRRSRQALRWHAHARGKVQVLPKCAVRDFPDFAVWYTPGVAAPCRAIAAEPERVYDYTNKGNSVAIVSDGSRVLGLGDIGPEAGLPVMEGKALLFKYLGGVDAVPICLGTRDPEAIIRVVQALGPSFGGINLEDIAQPKCFRVLDALRAEMDIPVWHDDQQGSATVVLAGLLNALRQIGKEIGRLQIALIGAGAAGVATYRLLSAVGADPARIIACDRQGTLHKDRRDLEQRRDEFPEKWRICLETNPDAVAGGIAEALQGADAAIAFAQPGPGVIQPEWVARMAEDPIVFACANPVPEIWPNQAHQAGARIVGTGRSDFANQVNNALAFPAIFRGALDVRARTITDQMAIAAARELAACAAERGLRDDALLPRMDDRQVVARVAAATALKAQEQGVARRSRTLEELLKAATAAIDGAHAATAQLLQAGLLPGQPPENGG